jgi:hypothetical protein
MIEELEVILERPALGSGRLVSLDQSIGVPNMISRYRLSISLACASELSSVSPIPAVLPLHILLGTKRIQRANDFPDGASAPFVVAVSPTRK